MLANLTSLYGEQTGRATFEKLKRIVDYYASRIPGPKTTNLSQRDAILITYADQVQEQFEFPLRTLATFLSRHLIGIISGIHILPFYPYSSDDGFSVIDFREVDPALGSWDDIAQIGQEFRLMFDAVINHTSVQSPWFHNFLEGDPHYQDYFIEIKGNPDLSKVVRPRALPLLTSFETLAGSKQVWTTFSADQVDLNYHNPEVLIDVIDTLLFYVSQGAEFIRLDAVAFLWKEIGTPCIHLPQTHRIIQLFRELLDQVAPHVRLITETNVPHAENISYFGKGTDEAQLVYNFALPPLVLYTIHTGDASYLSDWVGGLNLPTKKVTFFNFLASHDGIGINPIRGILPEEGVELLIQKTQEHGGLISYKLNPDGSKSPYELNINYFDALCNPEGQLSLEEQVDRFMAAQAIMLGLVGVPGIYFHSMFGSRGWAEGVKLTGHNRTINRQKLGSENIESELSTPSSLRFLIFERFTRLLKRRASCPAFHPFGDQRVIEYSKPIFAHVRYSPDHRNTVLCLQNVSNRPCLVNINQGELFHSKYKRKLLDIISRKYIVWDEAGNIAIKPYKTFWLEISGKELEK